ncbi:LysR family transcriptional regulator [Aggregatibacter actinomycetemcomitans]|uniref:LysR family transcriptional regulator n=1 Tax=Aggregatibacter actinomycetemcomitans TaxID=714 RepID=A0A142FZU5_AGGAC|nr:LysR family transcriptional regulator [Aggregatibacter actinomycetemcomitans]AFI86786.1 LysR family transcriptional regulator [Aggregatibacter actinomycetemcomitans D7S-1]KYK95336.1 LysR family transcriptional regulator [Aggregatibacter actinomycetemcomitans serotype d str. SA3733]AMQ93925.1 LysR family transcriptional regulator [Aggregatibacter actinomycetemcomitans]ANU82038.1 LysR family transcriptional regulator [Aggregatibacter actinomycetemcomitans]EKX99083.1 LysR substrate binding dom
MLNNLPNLNELYYFIQVVQAGSFAKAANKLGVTSSALSQNVKSLEKSLGLRLLNRTTRSISPTDAGEKLLAQITPHFHAIVGGLNQLDDWRNSPLGTIRINTSEVAANLLLYPKLKTLMQRYPELKIEMVVENRWVDIVEQGFDMGVRLGYALYKDMIAVKISDPVRMAVVASPDYLRGKPSVQAIADLPAHLLIGLRLSNQHGEAHWEFQHKGERITFQPEPHFSVNNGLRHQAALDGLGIAWLPKIVVEKDLEAGRLVELLDEYAMEYEPLYLYYPNRQGHSRAFELVVEALRV